MTDVSSSSLSLEQCAEYHRIHSAPVPVKAHFTCIVFSTLVVVALVWLAMTLANVVVRGTGRMRPIANEKGMEGVSEKINSEVSGRIQAVYVVENQAVSKGQVLVEIDTHQIEHQIDLKKGELNAEHQALEQLVKHHALLRREYQATVTKTQAEIDEAVAQYEQEVKRRAAKLVAAQADYQFESEKAARLTKLLAIKAVSPQDLSEANAAVARAKLAIDENQWMVDEHRIQVLRRTLEALEVSHLTKLHESQNAQAEKQVAIDKLQLELSGLEHDRQKSQILSPTNGVVTSSQISPGDVIQTGALGLTIQPSRDLEMVLAVNASDVGQLQLGMPVRIKMDAFDHQTYGTLIGKVRFISPDSTVKTDGEVPTASYELRVQLIDKQLQHAGNSYPMKLGMTGLGEVVIERDSLLSLLLKKVRHIISL